MKFYLASAFGLINDVKFVSDALESIGHEITVKWWSRDWCGKDIKSLPCSEPEWYAQEVIRRIYLADLDGIKRADAVILIGEPNQARKFNGANVEIGMGLALGKTIYSCGLLDRSVMYHPLYQFRDIYELLDNWGIDAEKFAKERDRDE